MRHWYKEEHEGDHDEAHDGHQHPIQDEVTEVQREPIPGRREVQSVFLKMLLVYITLSWKRLQKNFVGTECICAHDT